MSQITDNYKHLSELPFVAVTEQEEIRVITREAGQFKPRRHAIESKRIKVTARQVQDTVGLVLDAIKSASQKIDTVPPGGPETMMAAIELAAKRCAEAGSLGAVPVAIMPVSAYDAILKHLVDKSTDRVFAGGIRANLPFYPVVDRGTNDGTAYVFMCPIKGHGEGVVMPMPLLRYCEQGDGENVEALVGVSIPENFYSVFIEI